MLFRIFCANRLKGLYYIIFVQMKISSALSEGGAYRNRSFT